jgi:hypothetical protein
MLNEHTQMNKFREFMEKIWYLTGPEVRLVQLKSEYDGHLLVGNFSYIDLQRDPEIAQTLGTWLVYPGTSSYAKLNRAARTTHLMLD